LGILLAVQIESFLWGLGTALGELPPYFVAYKVSFHLSQASATRAELKRMTNMAEGHPMHVDKAEMKLIECKKK